jgi:hypothetical protein
LELERYLNQVRNGIRTVQESAAEQESKAESE